MRNSTGSPIFSDFQSEHSRVARFLTVGQRERRPWVRGCARTNHSKNDAQKGCAMQLNGITLTVTKDHISQDWSASGVAFNVLGNAFSGLLTYKTHAE